MTAKWIAQFNARLDELLGLTQKSSMSAHPQIDSALGVAEMLNKIDFDSELSPRATLDTRWARQTQMVRPARRLLIVQLVWVPLLIVFVALLAAFRQPVFAAVSRAFGYIFVPDVGFVPMDSTSLLKQPVLQEHDGQSVTVRRGVATARNIILFLEFNDVAHPVDGAWLETTSGENLKLLQWEYVPNTPGSHGIKMIFSPLPLSVTQTTLSLPEGWHLPLDWIPASQSNLPDTRVVPYVSAIQEPTSSSDLCVEKHGMNLCVLAATTSSESTSVLVETHPTNPNLHSSWIGPVWQEGVALKDEQSNVVPLERHEGETLIFPPLSSATQKVTLVVPALPADVDLINQNIVVNLGADPQPDTVIPLDANIQVLGTNVHFSKATFVGNGVNSLRLILNADEPIPTVDGITPLSFDLGKPDRVDDLYGSGMLKGSKDIFVELIRPNGKITGVLTIPVVRATVLVEGPFEFNFHLTNTSSLAPTPAEANPNTFSPAPTPTSLPMNGYSYTGEVLKTGDLLFTVFNGKNSELYAFTPDVDSQPRLVATLPGAVAQIYVHPDHQGLDYLAGSHEFRDGFSYIDNIRLYTTRFSESQPRLLYSFAANSQNMVGTAVEGDWSFDGHYTVFRLVGNSAPDSAGWRYVWLDLSCRQKGNCAPVEIPLQPGLDLFKAYFAIHDYRILFTGSDYSGTGKTDIFLLNFDPARPDLQPVNLTAHLSVGDGLTGATWTLDGKIFTLCSTAENPEDNWFCIIDPATSETNSGERMSPNLDEYRLFGGFWLSPLQNQVAAIIFPKNGTRASIPELRLLDFNGHLGDLLVSSQDISAVNFSPSGSFVSYIFEEKQQLGIYNIATGNPILVYSGSTPWTIFSAGWVP